MAAHSPFSLHKYMFTSAYIKVYISTLLLTKKQPRQPTLLLNYSKVFLIFRLTDKIVVFRWQSVVKLMQGLLQCMMRQVRHTYAHDAFAHVHWCCTYKYSILEAETLVRRLLF